MSKTIKFGEEVEGYNIPVLNEREIRASAGIFFLLMFISVSMALSKGNFVLLKYAIIIFLTDFLIRVLINPRFSPSLILGRLIVRNQAPEYVGAAQKKFAWAIGIGVSAIMFTLLVALNAYSPVTGILCFVCLIFLFFESAFGICLACRFYSWFYKEKAQYCPGEDCDFKNRKDIQKTSLTQVIIISGFIVYVILVAFLFNDAFHKKPHPLFSISSFTKSK